MPFGLVPLEQQIRLGSLLTIEELGPAGPDFKPRRIVLTGPSLPHMGAEWASELNVVTTWYPGNAVEATQQVLGPRELPSTWEGSWRRTLMGKYPPLFVDESGGEHRVVDPIVLRDAVESMMRSGVRLRVTWAVNGDESIGQQTAGVITSFNPDGTKREDRVIQPKKRAINVQIMREGRIKTFRTPIDRHTDIRWSIEFHWMSRGGRQDKAAAVRDDQNADAAAQALEVSVIATAAAVDVKIRSANPLVRKSATRFTLGQLEALANAPRTLVNNLTRQLQSNVNTFKRIGDVAKTLRSQPFAVANSVVDFARNTTSIANNFLNDMGRRPAEQISLKTKVSALLRGTNTFNRIANSVILNARRGQELDNTIRAVLVSGANRGALTVRASSATRAGDIIGIHISKFGDTPQRVSTKFYGNADQGAAILRANRLPWFTPTFRPGQILIIPALSTTAARANA